MWNNESSLKSLNNLPTKLSIDNLKNIQRLIDIDKYKSSMVAGRDLCGYYAPFCKNCDKSMAFPCAFAYIKMKQQEGRDFEILTDSQSKETVNAKSSTVEIASKVLNEEDTSHKIAEVYEDDKIEIKQDLYQENDTNNIVEQVNEESEDIQKHSDEQNDDTVSTSEELIADNNNALLKDEVLPAQTAPTAKPKRVIRIAVARRQRG